MTDRGPGDEPPERLTAGRRPPPSWRAGDEAASPSRPASGVPLRRRAASGRLSAYAVGLLGLVTLLAGAAAPSLRRPQAGELTVLALLGGIA
ncbi:MAG TPA: hypothetical protein VG245_04335, partial [Candidatus Dormibacteraeota bacterium]|nr:hypothetical protein [Candidatus Dormibacteraeota bacterium]